MDQWVDGWIDGEVDRWRMKVYNRKYCIVKAHSNATGVQGVKLKV
jgi:hypothetical protein